MVKCSEFCAHAVKTRNAASIDNDPTILLAGDLIIHRDEVEILQKGRWNHVLLTLQGEEPKLIIPVESRQAFNDNIRQTAELQRKIASLIDVFNRVDPIFDEALTALDNLKEPTLQALQKLQMDLKNNIYTLQAREKKEVAWKLNSLASKAPLEEIMQHPDIQPLKQSTEGRIKHLSEQLQLCEMFLDEVAGAIGGH